ncbi:hypothetical protein SBV1_2980020 [Verrucomicrobia bacterium]|nr:hypothetical protein SBV1_2980020 [Verrucomicrobiota bacterium]
MGFPAGLSWIGTSFGVALGSVVDVTDHSGKGWEPAPATTKTSLPTGSFS